MPQNQPTANVSHSGNSHYQVNFTPGPESSPQVQCGLGKRCKNPNGSLQPSGTRLQYMEDTRPGKPGYNVCPSCYAHYKNKDGTTRTQVALTSSRVQNENRHVEIHRNVSRAQRHEPTPVQAMPPPPPPVLRGQTRSQPNVAPARAYTPSHALYKNELQYQQARAFIGHSGMLGRVDVRLVYIPPGAVKERVFEGCLLTVADVPVLIPASEFKKVLFDAIHPKYLAALSAKWGDNFDFPLFISDVTLSDRYRAPINMDVEAEVEILKSHFFKSDKSGARTQFKTNAPPIVIYLLISDSWWREYGNYVEIIEQNQYKSAVAKKTVRKPTRKRAHESDDESAEDDSDSPFDEDGYSLPKLKGSKEPHTKKRLCAAQPRLILTEATVAQGHSSRLRQQPVQEPVASPSSLSQDRGTGTTGQPKHSTKTQPPSVKVQLRLGGARPKPSTKTLSQQGSQSLAEALASQTSQLVGKGARELATTRFVTTAFHGVKEFHLAELIDAANKPPAEYLYDSEEQVTFRIDFSSDQAGAFKMGWFGEVCQTNRLDGADVPSFFPTKKDEVFVKQMYAVNDKGAKVALNAASQLASLPMELVCLAWASALLQLVYDFIQEEAEAADSVWGSSVIPDIRFVKSGLAIEQNGLSSGLSAKVFMIEERIKSQNFTKFISNASSRLSSKYTSGEDPGHVLRRFLSFSQHVQYVKTDKLVFVSDYQGAILENASESSSECKALLTDPQIITSPAVKKESPVFAGGNVSKCYSAFEAEHVCNEYCKTFGLAPFDKV